MRVGGRAARKIGTRLGGRAGRRSAKPMRHAALERFSKTLRLQIPLRRRGHLLQKAPRYINRNEFSCRAGRHMRLRDRTSVEPLQKMIPEFAGELPGPIARALDL